MINESKFLEIVSKAEKAIDEAFVPLMQDIYTWSSAIIGFAIFIFVVFNVILPLFNGRNPIDITKILTMFVLFLSFQNYGNLIHIIDDFLQIPADNISAKIKKDFNLSSIQNATTVKVDPNKAPPPSSSSVLDNFNFKEGLYRVIAGFILFIYSAVMVFMTILLFICFILIKLSSVVAANVIITLGPLAFALSFLPNYNGMLPSMIKNLIAVRMWPVVSGIILLAAFKMGIIEYLTNTCATIHAQISNPNGVDFESLFEIIDLGPIILVFLMTKIILQTPSYVDMVLNASSSGSSGGMMGAGGMLGAVGGFISGGITTMAGKALGPFGGDTNLQNNQNKILGDILEKLNQPGSQNQTETNNNPTSKD